MEKIEDLMRKNVKKIVSLRVSLYFRAPFANSASMAEDK
jgi:hypothetical protein